MKLLFVGDENSTFIKRDIELLSRYYELFQLSPPEMKNKWPSYISQIKKYVKSCDVAFGWFAGWHTLPMVYYAKKYNKPSIIIVGGYDAVSFPEIGYGAFSNFKESVAAKYVLESADLLLPVSSFLAGELRKHAKISKAKILSVPLGCDVNFWKPNGKKENMVLTVASAKNITRMKVKGLDIFVRTAKYIPEAKFVVIGVEGMAREHLESMAPDNVKLIGYTPNEKLLPYYQKAKVYAQLSITESFGYAICEAMLSGCIPVCSKRGAMPEVVGNAGFYAPYGDIKATAQAIKTALNAPEELGLKARARIIQLFPLERRERALVKLISIATLLKYSTILAKWAHKSVNNLKVNIQQTTYDSIEITLDIKRRPILGLLGK